MFTWIWNVLVTLFGYAQQAVSFAVSFVRENTEAVLSVLFVLIVVVWIARRIWNHPKWFREQHFWATFKRMSPYVRDHHEGEMVQKAVDSELRSRALDFLIACAEEQEISHKYLHGVDTMPRKDLVEYRKRHKRVLWLKDRYYAARDLAKKYGYSYKLHVKEYLTQYDNDKLLKLHLEIGYDSD